MNELIFNGIVFKSYDDAYYVSEDGDVFSTYSRKILKHSIDLDGYHRVDIHSKHMKVHRLVYMTWVGEIPDGLQVNHKDDDKNNNHYTNLYAGTQTENIHDCIENNHRRGNLHYLTVYDRRLGKTLTFCPAKDFIEYSGHPCRNGSVKRMFSKNWYKVRYETLDYRLGKV